MHHRSPHSHTSVPREYIRWVVAHDSQTSSVVLFDYNGGRGSD